MRKSWTKITHNLVWDVPDPGGRGGAPGPVEEAGDPGLDPEAGD